MTETQSWVLTPEHFSRQRARLKQRRADVHAKFTADVAVIDRELADLERMEALAGTLAVQLAGGNCATEAVTPAVPPQMSALKPEAATAADKPFLSQRTMILEAVRAGAKERSEIIAYVQRTHQRQLRGPDTTTYLRRLRDKKLIKLYLGRWYPMTHKTASEGASDPKNSPADTVSQPGQSLGA